MSRLTGLLWRSLGNMLEARGLGPLAETCFRQAVDAAPSSDALGRLKLARMLVVQGRYGEALPLLDAAVRIKPRDAELWNLLGVVRRESADMPGAKTAFDQALSIDPQLLPAWTNYGNWLLADGEPAQALHWFERVLARDPANHGALNNRVAALLDLGKAEEAAEGAREALLTYPDSAPLHFNLGNSYLQLGKGFRAMQAFRRALEIEPDFQEAHYNLSLMGVTEHLGDAIAFLRKKMEVRGESLDLMNRLSIACLANRLYQEAEQLCRKVIEKKPRFAPAHVTLGNLLSTVGKPEEALECYELAIKLMASHYVHSNILFELNYLEQIDGRTIFERHLQWAALHEKPLLVKRTHERSREQGRRLKVGYLSPDFSLHPVGFLALGIVLEHDRSAFEIHCYAHVPQPDAVTDIFKSRVEHWHDTMGMSDAEVAEQIDADRIDILIDLSGHTANHRLPTFARKPAPVQATWIGYFHSTGMESIDYFITDPYSSPRGSQQHFSETPVYLPHTRFCYAPPSYAPPVASEPPCMRNGFVTFGCFNKIAKMGEGVVAAWAAILRQVPDSRLCLKSPALVEKPVCEAVRARFAVRGIAADRLLLRPASGHREMLEEYGDIDIALDPFPFTGGATSFEALLMGVPVVTFAGQALVSRQTAAMLMNIGQEDLVTESKDAYIACAVNLAQDRERLAQLRQSLRLAMAASPLQDNHMLVRDLETLYRRMWDAWCAGTKLPNALHAPG